MILLSELIDKVVLEEILSEKLLGRHFDIRLFRSLKGGFLELKKYVDQTGLRSLGVGSSRATYLLSSSKVLKLTMPLEEDFDQTKKEIRNFKRFGREYVPEVFDWDKKYRWVIVEPARTFDTPENMFGETGIRLQVLFNVLNFIETNKEAGKLKKSKSLKVNPEFIEKYNSQQTWSGSKISPNIPQKGYEFLRKFIFLTLSGVDDIDRPDHWGVGMDGRIVCIDTGVSQIKPIRI